MINRSFWVSEKRGTNMIWKRLLIGILAIGLAFLSPAARVSASGSEVPYQTYTYDKWGNATPSPNGYIPEKAIRGTGMGTSDFSDPQDLFYCEGRHEIYIVDTGNQRILVTDEEFNLIRIFDELSWQGKAYQMQKPSGIYVTDEGTMYIADQGNAELIICNQDGVILKRYDKPESNLIDQTQEYKPNKVVVDENGKIFIQGVGVYQGLIYLKPDGSFVKYFGPNKVEMTFKRIIMKMWKTILSDKASKNMQSFNPIEYGNIFMAKNGFIYATAAASENNSKLIVQLNPIGVDVDRLKKPVWYENATFADITVDDEGIITVVDGKTGRIYQCDKNGQLMFAFGGIGEQLGLFKIPTSIIEVGDKLYVLDSEKRNITCFKLTSFGEKVRTAISLYNMGLYEESIKPWEEVTRQNANYLLAYTGMGKAYYQLGKYELAMKNYRLANDRSNYSTAYKEYSLQVMRSNFGLVIAGIALACLVYRILKFVVKKHGIRKGVKG